MRGLTAVAALAVLAGCTISQSVDPVKGAPITELCIQQNEAVAMEGFLPEVTRQIESRGIATRVYDGRTPDDCRHVMTYTANWRWDFAIYLEYARFDVRDGSQPIGSATYDATQGGLSGDKFGPTAEKIRPLMDRLFPR